MYEIFKDMVFKDLVIYIDDIIIFSDTYDEHVATLRKVLQRLLDQKFWLKAGKCQFFAKRLDILEHILTPDGLHMDPKKRKKVLDFKVPSNRRELQGILGVSIFLSKFCLELASWSSTLSELQGENAPWRCTDTRTRALEKTKELVNNPQILKPWDHFSEVPKYLVCEATDIGLGSWIGQGELGSIRPCRFNSRKFSSGQLTYLTYQKELLAIVDSFKFFEAQLRDHKFTVLTNQQPLLSFLRPRQTCQKLVRWQAYMREFDLVIEHTAGKENLSANALSRKNKYSLDPTEEQDFIPHRIDPTEDNSNLQDSSITTNNLSISPILQEITMVSRSCINFKHTDCDYNKCAGRDESLGHHPSCPYLHDENDGDYEDYDDIKEEEMQSDEDTLSTIPEEIFAGHKFDPHSHIVEHDQLNGYHHISAPADDNSGTNNNNIPAIITGVVNDA